MTEKTCPFHQGIDNSVSETSNIVIDPTMKKCDGENCQLWVKLARWYSQEYEEQYEGCGLVTHIPWSLVKQEKKQ